MKINPEAFWGAAKDLGQLFENNSNCYADMGHDDGPAAMTEDKFIEVVTRLFERHLEKDSAELLAYKQELTKVVASRLPQIKSILAQKAVTDAQKGAAAQIANELDFLDNLLSHLR